MFNWLKNLFKKKPKSTKIWYTYNCHEIYDPKTGYVDMICLPHGYTMENGEIVAVHRAGCCGSTGQDNGPSVDQKNDNDSADQHGEKKV